MKPFISVGQFVSCGRSYKFDDSESIIQTDAKDYVYDQRYALVYNRPQYARASIELQALRFGFICGVLGRKPGSILDIGYGNGAFMLFARGQVETVYGYDVTGLPVPECTVVEDLMMSVDVITMWDVIEHLKDIDFLLNLAANMLVVTVPYCHFPNTATQEWFDKEYRHRKPDEHVRHFDPHSLALTLQRYGWTKRALSFHEDLVRTPMNVLPNTFTMAFTRG